MTFLRSARGTAILLLVAALAGLLIANSPAGLPLRAGLHAPIEGGWLDQLSIDGFIRDGLLAVFFFVVAVELRAEFSHGALSSFAAAVRPAIAAAGGVLVPIVIYLLVTSGTSSAAGWPVPTATDVAFALGVLAVFGRGLPVAVRAFLLALAILDDIVGILLIAVLFTDGIDLGALAAAAACVVVFALLSRVEGGRARHVVTGVRVVVAVAAWAFTDASGLHATLAGVALGLVMSPRPAATARDALEPWVNAMVLPVFAFTAALVPFPAVPLATLQPVFWGVTIALPLGKLCGIVAFGAGAQLIERRLRRRGGITTPTPPPALPLGDLVAVGALGGIGFTVSLLLSELVFAQDAMVRDQATLGVLCASALSVVISAIVVSVRARHYRQNRREVDA